MINEEKHIQDIMKEPGLLAFPPLLGLGLSRFLLACIVRYLSGYRTLRCMVGRTLNRISGQWTAGEMSAAVRVTNHRTPNTMPIAMPIAMPILALAMLLSGCDLAPVPIDVDPAESRMVVSSIVGPSQTVLVTVSRSFSALSAQDVDGLSESFVSRLLVDSAVVTMVAGATVDTLERFFDAPGVYAGSFGSSADYQDLRLSVIDLDTGEQITATTPLMPIVELSSADYRIEVEADGDSTTVVSYSFTDLPGESYYVLHAYNAPEEVGVDSLFGGGEASLLFGGGTAVFYERLILDSSFDDVVIADTVRFDEFATSETIVLAVSHISEGYFRFLEARRRSGGILSSLSNEPVNHPTNVEGGYGYFSAHRPQLRIVERR